MSLQKIIDLMYLSLNRARTNPSEQSAFYQQNRNFFNGLLYRDRIKTRQGQNALQHLVTQLKSRSPQKPLKWSFALHMAADQQAIKLGDNGLITTENSPYHVQLPQRCKQYGIVRGRLSQVYEFGGNSPEQILETLLIDDGLMSRKRRKTLLDPVYNYVGIGSSFHEKYGTVTVIILAEDIISLVSPGDQGNYFRREALPQGETYTFDIEESRDNERRRLQHENSKYQSAYGGTNTSHDQYSSFDNSRQYGYDVSNRQNSNRKNERLDDSGSVMRPQSPPKIQHQNALKNDSHAQKEKSKCQIF